MVHRRPIAVCLIGASLWAGASSAAELGRQRAGAGPASPPEISKAYRGGIAETGWGLEAALDWTSVDWDAADTSNRDDVFAPQVSLLYGASPNFDMRASVRYFTASDEDDLDVVRIGVGAKLWFGDHSEWVPYLGLLLNYYLLDSDVVDDVEGTIGVSAEAGVAYIVSDSVMVRIGFQGETLLQDAEGDAADDAGGKADLDLTSLGLGLGVVVSY